MAEKKAMENQLEKPKTDIEWLNEMGLCHKCRKEKAAPGRKYCFDCLDKTREENRKRYNSEKAKEYQVRRRELYQEKKIKGICIRCSRQATHGLYCYEHAIEAKRHSADMSQKRKNARHDRGLIPEQRKKAGQCLWCGKEAVPGMQYCEEHRQRFSQAGKKGKYQK